MQHCFLGISKKVDKNVLKDRNIVEKEKTNYECILFRNIHQQKWNFGKKIKEGVKCIFCPSIDHTLRENLITTVQTAVCF